MTHAHFTVFAQVKARLLVRVASLPPAVFAVRQLRRVASTRPGRVAVALWRFAWRRTPRWLRRVLAVCVVIPGPQDEAVAGVVLLLWLLGQLAVSSSARGELAAAVRGAWRP